MTKAYIFDLDGTLVDSELIASETLAELLPDLGLSGAEIAHLYRGWRFATILETFSQKLGRVLDDRFIAAYRARSGERYERELKAFPGVHAMLETIDAPMAIASSGPPQKIARSLAITGLDRFFPVHTYSAYTLNSWKPEPDLFLHAARALGYAPSDVLVVEDSEVGLEAARRAGMRAILHNPEGHPIEHVPHFARYDDFHTATERLFRFRSQEPCKVVF